MKLARVVKWSWRRRWLTGPLGLILLLLGTRLVWGWWVGRELEGQIAAIRARGEPVRVEDLKIESVPDEENAAVLLKRAAGSVSSSPPAPRTSRDFDDYPPYSQQWRDVARRSEVGNAHILQVARKIRKMRFEFRTTTELQQLAGWSGDLYDMVKAAEIISGSAIYQHLSGNNTEAMERILDLLHLAAGLHQDPFQQDSAWTVDVLACDSAMIVVSGLKNDCVLQLRGQINTIISQLLDEKLARPMVQKALAVERVWSSRDRRDTSWMLRPLRGSEVVRLSERFSAANQALAQANWPAAQRLLGPSDYDIPADDFELTGLGTTYADRHRPRFSRWFGVFWDDGRRLIELMFRDLAERRTAAVALAWHLYRAEHGGRWPIALKELVPSYLPAVPEDPYREEGQKIAYIVLKKGWPNGDDRPVLYFEEGLDEAWTLVEPHYGWYARGTSGPDSVRQYRDLTRLPLE